MKRWLRRAVWLVVGLAMALSRGGAITLPADAVVTEIHPGARMFQIRRSKPALAIDGFVWRRDEPRLQLVTTAGRDQISGLEPTSRQIARLATAERRPIAAVNGDFYSMTGPSAGATAGLFVRQGELLSQSAGRPAFAILSDGSPAIAAFTTTLEVLAGGGAISLRPARLNNSRGDNMLVLYSRGWASSTKTGAGGVEVVLASAGRLTPNYRQTLTIAEVRDGQGNTPIPADGLVLSGSGTQATALRQLARGQQVEVVVTTKPDLMVREAVGGAPILMTGGKNVYPGGANEPRHPRTAIGFDNDEIVAVAIDGRRAGHSIGMTLPELAKFMDGLGCRDAINLDGGGSTTCWVRGAVLNRPSDGRERSVANALALLTTGRLGTPQNLTFEPAGPLVLATGATLQPTVRVTDELLNPLPDPAGLTLSVEGGIGLLADGVFRAGDQPGTGRLAAQVGAARGTLDITVVDRLATLQVQPATLQLLPGATATLAVSGATPDGHEVLVPAGRLTMTVEGGCGQLDGTTFTAGPGGTGAVVLRGYGAEARVPVQVAGPQVVDDFEGPLAPTFQAFPPEEVTGTLTARTGDAGSGQGYARLAFQLGNAATTRAAYLRLDRKIGAALALRAMVRGDGQRVWLRVAIRDGNDVRETYILHDGILGKEWQTVQCDLPAGLQQPLVWESVYVVTLKDGPTATTGWVDWDRLEALQTGPLP